jgi:hypothetical protein
VAVFEDPPPTSRGDAQRVEDAADTAEIAQMLGAGWPGLMAENSREHPARVQVRSFRRRENVGEILPHG